MKLTLNNYKQATKNIDFNKLPEAAQQAHKDFDTFVDFYNEDENIKEMLDNHFRIVEPYLEYSFPKDVDSLKAFLKEGQELIYQQIDISEGQIVNQKKVKVKQIKPSLILQIPGSLDMKIDYPFLKKSAKFDKNGFLYSVGKNMNFQFLWNQKRDKKQKVSTSKNKVNVKKTTKKESIPKKSKDTIRQVKRKPNEVDLIPLEVKIIRRYISFYDKKVTERQVSLLYKTIQKAATEKTIRRTSKYAEEIKKIGDDLARTYKAMAGSCTFEISETTYKKLKSIVDSYGVAPSIALIKRFINLYGNITIAKAKRLLTSIINAKKKGKINKSDKAYGRIIQIQKHLEDYLKSDKLHVTQIELNGLKGLTGLGK